MNTEQKILFFRRLSLYLKAGVPIVQGLSYVIQDTKSRESKRILFEIESVVTSGQGISVALQRFPKLFDRFCIGIINSGELSGNLAYSLEELSHTLHKQQQLKKKILNTLTYPALVLCVSFCVALFLITCIFPKILPILEGLKANLPLSTKVLIFCSNFLRSYWWLSLLILGVLILISTIGSRYIKIRRNMECILLKIPFVNNLFLYYSVTIFSKTLSVQLNGGIHILSALELTQATVPGILYGEKIILIRNKITQGHKLSSTLQDFPQLFPILMRQMISVGEATGTLGLNLQALAEVYEERLDDLSKSLTTLIEPTLMICMGLVVGFIAMAIISPIYEMTQNLQIQ